MIPEAAAHRECVVLLHGLGRTSRSMVRLQGALEEAGFAVANIDYASRRHPIEELAVDAVGRGLAFCRVRRAHRIHFVTHSLGGILVRHYLANHDVPELGRVVMLAPPNQGSEVVDVLSHVPGFVAITGPAGLQLGTDPASLPNALGPVSYPVGVIAGTRSINPLFSALLRGADDGAVSVARTRVQGMTDLVQIRASHPFIMRSNAAIRQVLAFLAQGAFLRVRSPDG